LEDGVCVEDPILSEDWIKVGSELSLKNRTLPSNAVSYKLTFTLEDDIYGCNEYFYI
jgi:hypothetical protein